MTAAVGGFAMSMISTLSGLYLIGDVGLGPLQLVLVGSVLGWIATARSLRAALGAAALLALPVVPLVRRGRRSEHSP